MTAIERFWSKVAKSEGCWEWTGQLGKDGYGRIKAYKKTVRAHRFVWAELNRPLVANEQILHHCDNRKCVRPDHLHVGSHKENMAEMKDRRRAASGARNGMTKLTEEDVRAIRDSIEPQRTLAKRYGVCQGAISHARLRKNWALLDHAPKPYPENQIKGRKYNGK